MSIAKIGAQIDELDTPTLLIDLDTMERNIETMAGFFRSVPAELRPHAKTHKCPVIAQKQIEAGAIGVTCAKLGEAEAMVAGGIRDVLIANQVVGEPKVTRLVNLAEHSDVIVAVDSYINMRHLADRAKSKGVRLNVLVEVDIGNNRCGTDPGEPTLELAREVAGHNNLNLRGLLGYEGFCQNIRDIEERREKAHGAMAKLINTKELLEEKGLDMEIVSAGGTGTHMITGRYPGVTEVEAGSYVFMDATYSRVEGLEHFNCALTVLTTIMSLPRQGVAVCDAGLKAITIEPSRPLPTVKGLNGVLYERASEEHGRLKVEPDSGLRVGDKLEVIVSHCCTNTNLYDYYHCIREGSLEDLWKISARGKSQ
ncbi:MAG: DSD1 family PLP-dependent enzyme [Candidatus Bathyarchaeota archaeon]|nr:MAG: DSD1 family PLP-dependent enzyme [Candidatus Bathyarchaeota archaeon]